jgi:hypothetical protein
VTTFALLGSPFLGPEVWEPVAGRLAGAGHDVVVLAGRGSSPEEVGLSFAAGLPDDDELVLVPHSNAGLYVAGIVAARPVGAAVFVDAVYPGPGRTTPVSPPELVEELADRVDEDGLLPPWTRWWPDAEVDALFPDETVRASVVAGEPRVPASYVSSRVVTPPGWESVRGAYLAFGETYALEVDLAQEWKWPVVGLEGGHLHMLVDPDGVAGAIAQLAARAGTGRD